MTNLRTASVVACLALLLAASCARRERHLDAPVARPVEMELVRPGPHQATLTLLGVVVPSQTITLACARSGVVSYPQRFDAGLRTGEAVAASELVATIDDVTTHAALTEARLASQREEARLAVLSRGFDGGVVPHEQLADVESAARLARERLRTAERSASLLAVRAPRAGRLVVDAVHPAGSTVAAGTELARLAVDGPSRVEAWAAAADRDVLAAGLTATLSMPGHASAGRGIVREVAPVVDAAGTVRVVLDVEEWTAPPAPGEGVEVRVELPARPSVITVPETAVSVGGGGAAVFVVDRDPDGAEVQPAHRRSVEVGRRGNGRIEILSGLAQGDHVAVAGVEFLSDGDLVTAVEKKAAPAPGAGT